VAFFLAKSSLSRIHASGDTLGGEGLATAGRVFGIVGTFILVAWVLLLIVRVFTRAASISSTG
jgi:hypothetical protein